MFLENDRKIKTKKRGNSSGIIFFKYSLRLFGLRGTYGFLYIVCFYYLLFDKQAVNGAIAYIEKRFPNTRSLKIYLHVYKLFISQGKQLIDRFLVASGSDMFDIVLNGYDDFVRMAKDPDKGLILLTAHVGNWQVALKMLKKIGKTIYLVMRPEDNPAIQKSLQISKSNDYIKIISPEQYLGGIIEIMNVLKKGNIVSIMGDRKYGFESTDVSFLGKTAAFPYGAFSIAQAADCPVVPLLTAKESLYKHVIDVSHVYYPKYDKKSKKKEQIGQWVQKFASLLEVYVEKYPYQCFLFHDIWCEGE